MNTAQPIRSTEVKGYRTECILKKLCGAIMNLRNAQEGKVYTVSRIDTDDDELNSFLFSLGCYTGEPITVVSRRKSSCVVSIKDGRYNIDMNLAEAIIIEE